MIARFMMHVLLLFTVLGAMDRAGAADMNAWLDRTRIGEGETVQLKLEAQGQVSGRPDTTPLEQDFEILGMSTGSRVNIVNGRTDATTTWVLTLSPRRSGKLAIPALHVGNHRSAPLSLEVSEAPAPASGGDADILIETRVEPRTPYVQGQVLYTIRLLHAVPISSGSLSEPAAENILVQRLGEDRESAAIRNGRRYQLIERRYALFPQASGPLELAAPVFNGEIPDANRRRASPLKRFFGNDPFFGDDPFDDLLTPTRRVRVRGQAEKVDVMPRPAATQGAHWLPAQRLELKGDWQPDSSDIQIGEPVSLLLELEAQGLTAGQLPDLVPETLDGFTVYPDQAQRQTDSGDAGVTGHLRQKIAFIPERTGDLTLPAIEVHWWDTQADRERVATLPGRMLRVLPATGQPAQATRESPPSVTMTGDKPEPAIPATPLPAEAEPQPSLIPAPGAWPWISAALATGWLLTLVIWWRRAHGFRAAAGEKPPFTPKSPGTAAARKQFLAACHNSDATNAHRSLLAWAAAHWPTDPPGGLEALAQRLPDPETRAALAELNRARYREDGQWNGTRLLQCLKRLPEPDTGTGRANAVLAPLYPETTRQT